MKKKHQSKITNKKNNINQNVLMKLIKAPVTQIND